MHTEDLFAAIAVLKKQRQAVIMAHYYQDPDIQDVADVLGDSLALARAAQRTSAKVIVLAGVHFMAETAKILNPEKVVVVPDLQAGCSLADSCPAEALAKMKAAHPDHVVVTYVNTTAAVKALSDYVCTSTNACAVINSIDAKLPILFAPDINLGRYLMQQTGRKMLLWQGACIVHETFNEAHVLGLMQTHPEAAFIAHPECEPGVLQHAEFVGSTKALLDFTQSDPRQSFIVGTEAGILHTMQRASPEKTFMAAAPQQAGGAAGCGCSTCPYMKLNTLEKVHRCLRDLTPEVNLPEPLRLAALKPLERMVTIG
jgi:quinolinate synthase